MKLCENGTVTSAIEVTNVTRHAIWILVHGREYMLDYKRFPWFSNATIKQVCNVTVSRTGTIRWPDLDVDLDVKRISEPDKFPLVQKSRKNQA